MKMLEITNGLKIQVHIKGDKVSKSIILIGNADVKKNEDFGDVIDSFDNVARFNRFEINGYEKYIGTKTTHWILNKYLYGLDFFQKKLKGDFDVKRYVISVDTPNKNSNLKNITYVLGQESENYKKYFSLFKTVMGKGALPAYKPETGILTILYFLDRFETIYLHNFDFGKTPHYYSKKSDSGKVTKIADLPNQKHAWNYSKKIVEYFIEKNRIKIVNEKNKIGVTDGE